ncbi:MAG TPA: alpha/beta hydrolase [Streptosporangiaceae bacterium]|nr:alpha/beta hydrolase [Streptosporangiaceae bacterium]
MTGAPDGFVSRWHTVDGLRLHALEWDGGPGTPVVLLPGLVTASRSMVPLARALAGHGIHPWIPDPPGFGYSDKPRRALSLRDEAKLIAQWLAVTGSQPAGLLGNSFGSQIAAAMAASHPGKVDRLVLLSPTVDPALRRRLSWLPVPSTQVRAGHQPYDRWRIDLLARLHAAIGDDAPLRLLNVAEYGCASLPRAASTVRIAVLEPMEPALPDITVPTLVIRADRDHLSSPDWAGRLVRLLPGGQLARLPGVGHNAFYAHPDMVAAVAAPFFSHSGPVG